MRQDAVCLKKVIDDLAEWLRISYEGGTPPNEPGLAACPWWAAVFTHTISRENQLLQGMSLRDIPWFWGVDDYPGLGQIVFACYAAYLEANTAAVKMLNAPKRLL